MMTAVKEKPTLRSCLSRQSKVCASFFITTKNVRICNACKNISHEHDARPRKDFDEELSDFWKKLK